MSSRVERRLFLQADSDRAVLLSPSAIYHDADRLGDWFPKSQIEITNTDVRHGGKKLVTVLIPEWLLKSKRQMPDAEPGHEFGHNAHAQEPPCRCPGDDEVGHAIGCPRGHHLQSRKETDR